MKKRTAGMCVHEIDMCRVDRYLCVCERKIETHDTSGVSKHK